MLEIYQYDKADRRSFVKIYFHGFRGLGARDVRGTSVLRRPEWNGDFPNKLKMHFVCTNALLANAAFKRCADVITFLILKYGPALKQKWNLNEWTRNIQAESLWKDIACKRYQRYFICMMNMKSFPV